MKINFTKKQFKTLLEIFNLATWIVLYDVDNDAREHSNILELETYLASYAKQMGCENMVFEHKNKLHINPENEKEFEEIIENYNNNIFWYDLNFRITEKLLSQRYNKEEWTQLSEYDKFSLQQIIEALLNEEFCASGIDKLMFSESFVKNLWAKIDDAMKDREK